MTITPTYKSGTINCTPFDKKLKSKIIQKVLMQYPGLSENYSAEGGFQLPLTNQWLDCNLRNKQYLRYHNARQLRFVTNITNDYIIGVRLKDDINYMTDDEIYHIISLINSSIE